MSNRQQRNMNDSAKKLKTVDIMYVAMFAALIAVCAWIAVPSAVSFTMQTFGVFSALFILGGKRGFLAIFVYVLLGAAGIPVFSGFSGGFGVIAGATGGYILGFMLCALAYWLITTIWKNEKSAVIGAIIGQIVCYLFGTLWFVYVYGKGEGKGFLAVLTLCVFPFIVPDAVKLILAYYVGKRLKKNVAD